MECLPTIASLDSLHIRTRVYDSQVDSMPEHSMSLELELKDSPTPTRIFPHPPVVTTTSKSKTTIAANAKKLTKTNRAHLETTPQHSSSTLGTNGGTGPGYASVLKQVGCAAATMGAVWTMFT